ncbi:alpha/beta fold hydrolase [Pseudomonas sp. dw_358]|uniref:alpha/beta fold hydrolase n=1 Tax=Pseudomonas sp. dw_358 TaxID=2720083 RepID=UPI0021167F11|nr:alpha/beta fold hydrolase [Pseudomonas sp. dw_358]
MGLIRLERIGKTRKNIIARPWHAAIQFAGRLGRTRRLEAGLFVFEINTRMSEMPRSPILLIHGLIGSLRDLLPVFARQGIQAFAPDLLGYGTLQDTAPSLIHLDGQVAHLACWLKENNIERVNLLGHSVGGAVAMRFARAYPERVASVISVEGNFTLSDAFWSAGVARMAPVEAEAMLRDFRGAPGAWLARSGIDATPANLEMAARLLANQPASTLQATACSVVDVTGAPSFLEGVQAVFGGAIPVHLVAGERSFSGWNVPAWALESAASITRLPGGHLMMVEDPEGFVSAMAGMQR